jgi:hypothetical protein
VNLAIYCVDVGSIAAGNFAWASLMPGQSDCATSTSIESLAESVVAAVRSEVPVALGFECPVFVPVREAPERLTMARQGEGRRPWSAAAGTGCLATGLVQYAWLLARIRRSLQPEPAVLFEWLSFVAAGKGLFLWEAFVSGGAKTGTHGGDAVSAVLAFHRALPDPSSRNQIRETRVLSLLGAALLWAGWNVPPAILSQPCLVLAA